MHIDNRFNYPFHAKCLVGIVDCMSKCVLSFCQYSITTTTTTTTTTNSTPSDAEGEENFRSGRIPLTELN